MRPFAFAFAALLAGAAAFALHAAPPAGRPSSGAHAPDSGSHARPSDEGPSHGPGRVPGIAVAELFTSEGCSSCPPADRLLADLAAEADRAGEPLFALSFHVDYWNHLGWADPFSRPGYTERQQAYAAALGGGVYTPEMIVNGKDAFVGSDALRARRAIRTAWNRPARARFRRAEARPAQGSIQVTFEAAGPGAGALSGAPPAAPAGAVIRAALVQSDTAVPVERGENGGRTLRHHDVVRAFATARPGTDGSGEVRLPFPPGARPEALRVILYAQDPETLEILGATETAISAALPLKVPAPASIPY